MAATTTTTSCAAALALNRRTLRQQPTTTTTRVFSTRSMWSARFRNASDSRARRRGTAVDRSVVAATRPRRTSVRKTSLLNCKKQKNAYADHAKFALLTRSARARVYDLVEQRCVERTAKKQRCRRRRRGGVERRIDGAGDSGGGAMSASEVRKKLTIKARRDEPPTASTLVA